MHKVDPMVSSLQERFGMQAVHRGKHLTMSGWQRQWMDNDRQAFGYVLSFFFGLRTRCHTTFAVLSASLIFEQFYLPHVISKATSPNISRISWHLYLPTSLSSAPPLAPAAAPPPPPPALPASLPPPYERHQHDNSDHESYYLIEYYTQICTCRK